MGEGGEGNTYPVGYTEEEYGINKQNPHLQIDQFRGLVNTQRNDIRAIIERLSMTFTANGKMKFSFCQNKEKLDLFKLLCCLLPRYIEELLKRVRQVEKRKFSCFYEKQLPGAYE